MKRQIFTKFSKTIIEGNNWVNKHWKAIQYNYSRDLYFNKHKDTFENALNKNYYMLSINLYSQYEVNLQVFVETNKDGFTEEKSQSVGIPAGVGIYNILLLCFETIEAKKITT